MDDADTWRGATDLARRLVRIDTRGGREAPAAALVADRLDGAGFDVRVEEPISGRANVVARFGPAVPRVPVTFTGHLDTVPADPSGWSFDPMSGELRDGRLLGRGSSDMKAGVACQVEAAIRAARESPRDTAVQLIFTFGEETGCHGPRRSTRRHSPQPTCSSWPSRPATGPSSATRACCGSPRRPVGSPRTVPARSWAATRSPRSLPRRAGSTRTMTGR
ncbi:hypothetical protein GCM10017744_002250 [Streptomyces antimycoticus]